MAKRRDTRTVSIFEALEMETVREEGAAACTHLAMRRTETIWPGETFARLTMTCKACGWVRGRYPGE